MRLIDRAQIIFKANRSMRGEKYFGGSPYGDNDEALASAIEEQLAALKGRIAALEMKMPEKNGEAFR